MPDVGDINGCELMGVGSYCYMSKSGQLNSPNNPVMTVLAASRMRPAKLKPRCHPVDTNKTAALKSKLLKNKIRVA